MTQTTAAMMAVSYALQTAAEDEFDAWLARQSDEVRAMAESDQVEMWAKDAETHG